MCKQIDSLLLMALLSCAMTASSCTKAADSLSITGKVAGELRVSNQPLRPGLSQGMSALTVDGRTVNINRICGLPVGLKQDTMPGDLIDKFSYCVDLASDGSFTVPVGDTGCDWVYVLVDSTLPKKDQVIGFVGLQDIEATGASLISWPADKQIGNVDVGTVSKSSDDGVKASGTVADAQKGFSLSLGQLETLAKSSQLMRAYKNDFVNYDPSTHVYYSGGPEYSWTINVADADGTWSPIPGSQHYQGYGIGIFTNDGDLHKLCKGGGKSFALTPPSTIVRYDVGSGETETFSPTGPLTNAGLSAPDSDGNCFSTAGPIWQGGGADRPYLAMLGGLRSSYPGTWTVSKDGMPVAWFDFDIASPFINGDPNMPFRVPLPRFKFTTDASKVITQIDVSWSRWDTTSSSYVEATSAEDLAMIQRIIGGRFNIHLGGWSAPGSDKSTQDEKMASNGDADQPMKTTFSGFANTWKLVTDTNDPNYLGLFVINYTAGRSSMTFMSKHY